MRSRSIIGAAVILTLLLCGCSKAVGELPEDVPYNRFLNGKMIMETENGYYTNSGQMYLRFYERDTENQIALCARPECQHDGNENCPATYKNLETVNTVLYDDALYVLTLEKGENVLISLYRAALDGTSLTKVGDAFSVANSAGVENEDIVLMGNYFIIHKGYAYIPYHLTVGKGTTSSFAGSGLVKMDISNGRSEQILSGENYFSPYPHDLKGSGNYVYFSYYGYNNSEDQGLKIYNIDSGEIYDPDLGIINITIGDKYIFSWTSSDGKWQIYRYDKSNIENGIKNEYGSYDPEIIVDDLEFNGWSPSCIAYNDKLLWYNDGIIKVYSDSGEKLGEAETDMTDIMGDAALNDCAVSNGKVYYEKFVYPFYKEKYYSVVFSCPIDDIISGNAVWKFEYGRTVGDQTIIKIE